MFRPHARGSKHRDGFGGFGQAAFLGQCGKRQKAAAGADEAGQQGCGGQCVGAGVGRRKGQGDDRV
ncbi:hypothetical protein [Limnohabitans sp. Rim28]|uniref:hypothetical protein n=1 Tax=Limnohabitans sp. Rim28 TaxID=1100720 RepID=UPI00030C2234|nr:hypothetical protein [Limnohabitans sp. Rim28]